MTTESVDAGDLPEDSHACDGCGEVLTWEPSDALRLELHAGHRPVQRVNCGSCGRDNAVEIEPLRMAEWLSRLLTRSMAPTLTTLAEAMCPNCQHRWQPASWTGDGEWFLALEFDVDGCHLRLTCPGCGEVVPYARDRGGKTAIQDDPIFTWIFLGELLAMCPEARTPVTVALWRGLGVHTPTHEMMGGDLSRLANLTPSWDAPDTRAAFHDHYVHRVNVMLYRAFGDDVFARVHRNTTEVMFPCDEHDVPVVPVPTGLAALTEPHRDGPCGTIIPEHLDAMGELERTITVIVSTAWCMELEHLMSRTMTGTLVATVIDAVGLPCERASRDLSSSLLSRPMGGE